MTPWANLPLGVAKRGRVVQAIAHDGGVGGPVEGQGHLVGGRSQGVLDDLPGDGIDGGLPSRSGVGSHVRSPNPHFSSGGVPMAQDFFLQRVLASEGRSGFYVRGSMCALKEKRQARARPAPSVPACRQNKANKVLKINGLSQCIQRPGEKCGLTLTLHHHVALFIPPNRHEGGDDDGGVIFVNHQGALGGSGKV